MYKFLAVALLFLVGWESFVPKSTRAQDPSTQKTIMTAHEAITICSVGQNIEVTGEIRNSLVDALQGRSGVDARDLVIRNEPAFLSLLPEEDRLEALDLYFECINSRLSDPPEVGVSIIRNVSPSPQPSLDVSQLTSDCSEPIPALEDDPDPQKEELAVNSVRNSLNSCNILIDQQQGTQEIHIQRLRRSIFLWYWDASGNYPVELAIQDYLNLSLPGNASPRYSFYKAYSLDFDQLVLNRPLDEGQLKECPPTYSRYRESITGYLEKYQEVLLDYREARASFLGVGEPEAIVRSEELLLEEAYIIIEIGHWLLNRDRKFEAAEEMFDIVLAHYSGTNSAVEYNALVGRGLVLNARRSPDAAVRLFETAIELESSDEIDPSDQLRANLAAAHTKVGRYGIAANLYDNAASISEKNRFRWLMESAYANLLEGVLAG